MALLLSLRFTYRFVMSASSSRSDSNEAHLFVCPLCHGELESSQTAEDVSLLCRGCGAVFPFVENTVPVFLENPKEAFSTSFAALAKARRSMLQQITDLGSVADSEPWRAETLSRRRAAIEANLGLLDTVRSILARTVELTPEDVADLPRVDEDPTYQSFDRTLRYLERDRARTAGGELEVEAITEAVRAQITGNISNPEACLVLGAGMGRIGEALTDLFTRVYQVEASPTMQVLNALLRREKSIKFYRTSAKTVRSREDCAKQLEARLTEAPSSNEHSFVGDATRLPLPPSSIDVIASIYFTDAMIPDWYIHEVKRVLRPNGSFVHFGPNGWHFRDVGGHLALDELKERFVRWGFEVDSEEWVPTTHLKDDRSVHTSSFLNYSFVATMSQGGTANEPVGMDSHVSLVREVKLVEEQTLDESGAGDAVCSITTATGDQYRVSTYVAEFLKRLDPARRVGALVEDLAEEYDVAEGSEQRILTLIQQLVEKGVLGTNR